MYNPVLKTNGIKFAVAIIDTVLGRNKIVVYDTTHIKLNTVIISARNKGVYKVVGIDNKILKLETISKHKVYSGKLKFYCRDIFIVPLSKRSREYMKKIETDKDT